MFSLASVQPGAAHSPWTRFVTAYARSDWTRTGIVLLLGEWRDGPKGG